jgi:hypothetical protein
MGSQTDGEGMMPLILHLTTGRVNPKYAYSRKSVTGLNGVSHRQNGESKSEGDA